MLLYYIYLYYIYWGISLVFILCLRRYFLCLIVGRGRGGGGVKLQNVDKNPQFHLIIIREWPKNNPPILRNLDNFPADAFYSIPPPTKEFKSWDALATFIAIRMSWCAFLTENWLLEVIRRLTITVAYYIYTSCTHSRPCIDI